MRQMCDNFSYQQDVAWLQEQSAYHQSSRHEYRSQVFFFEYKTALQICKFILMPQPF
jgi:hypothetical protein